ncbi:MAG: hypothetical protein HY367_01660 [Candidatus Aenigmarchaeota archaeon]|nr:hypothetical protein [Candidatus Aenigmarchaeota archaeon]
MEPTPLGMHGAAFFSRVFIYVVIFNVAILATSVVLHEAGHFVAGTLLAGCTGEIILYDMEMSGPYTALDCPAKPDVLLLHAASMGVVIPYSLLFLALKGMPERHYFTEILGISMFTAALDLRSATGLDIAYYLSLSAGIATFLFGQYMLVDRTFARLEEKMAR